MQNYIERKPDQDTAMESSLERIQIGIRELGEDDRALVLDMVERLLQKE